MVIHETALETLSKSHTSLHPKVRAGPDDVQNLLLSLDLSERAPRALFPTVGI